MLKKVKKDKVTDLEGQRCETRELEERYLYSHKNREVGKKSGFLKCRSQ